MEFNLTVRPDKIKHHVDGTEIISVYELKIDSENYRREYEKDKNNLFVTLRHILYMFYYPFGVTYINGDDSFDTMYEMFCRRKEVESVTVMITQTEFIDDISYGNNEKKVKCSFTLDIKDQSNEK